MGIRNHAIFKDMLPQNLLFKIKIHNLKLEYFTPFK